MNSIQQASKAIEDTSVFIELEFSTLKWIIEHLPKNDKVTEYIQSVVDETLTDILEGVE